MLYKFNFFFTVGFADAIVGDLSELKKISRVLQEGCEYRVKIYFYVQREIVQGLKYLQSSYRAGVRGKICCWLDELFYVAAPG